MAGESKNEMLLWQKYGLAFNDHCLDHYISYSAHIAASSTKLHYTLIKILIKLYNFYNCIFLSLVRCTQSELTETHTCQTVSAFTITDLNLHDGN